MESNSNLSEVDLYLNGQTEKNPSHTFVPQGVINTGNLWDVNIGTDFNGSIDDVRIYDRALGYTEVLALYNLEKPKIPLTDSNFQTAVNLWFSDETNATASVMDTSATGMFHGAIWITAFNDRSAFNENISTWDLSNVTNTTEAYVEGGYFL